MRPHRTLLAAALFVAATLFPAIVSPAAAQTPASGDLVALMVTLRGTLTGAFSVTGTDGYTAPTGAELAAWTAVVDSLLAGRYVGAAAKTTDDLPGYTLFAFTDTGLDDRLYYVLRTTAGMPKGWGTVVVNPDFTRTLAIEVPHPLFDTNTDTQGADIFRRTGARLLLVAGAHRCANDEATTCTGTTSVCGVNNGPYRASDMAHATGTPFQDAHAAAVAADPTMTVFNLHGNGQASCEDVFLSNGSASVGRAVLASLAAAYAGPDSVTIGYVGQPEPTSTCGLTGTHNVQGRLMNGSADACTIAAVGASVTGRFVHVEQSRGMRDFFGAYEGFIDAINATFGVLPVELTAFEARADGPRAVLSWRTASETDNAGFEVEHAAGSGGVFERIGFVAGHGTTAEAHAYRFHTPPLAPGRHRFRLRQLDFDGASGMSPVTEVTLAAPAALWLSAPSPHPARAAARLTLVARETRPATVEAFDALGRRVAVLFDGVTTGGEPVPLTLDAAGLPPGLYLVRAHTAGATATQRVVLRR